MRRAKWIVFAFLSAGLALWLAYSFRSPLLTGLANLWIVDSSPSKVDAIVVLGGGLRERPMEAARLYWAGYAPKILVTRPRLEPTDVLGITRSHAEIGREVMLANGVPDSAIIFVGNDVASTFDEAKAVRRWAASSGARSFLIPTGLFHTRRVRWIFHRILRSDGADVRVMAINSDEYRSDNWWRNEEGVLAFQNEVVKFVYYEFKY